MALVLHSVDVYDKHGTLLGSAPRGLIVPPVQEPSFEETRRQRIEFKRIWHRPTKTWIVYPGGVTKTRPPVAGVATPYNKELGDGQFSVPNVGAYHYLREDRTEDNEKFFADVQFLFDADENSVGCKWHGGAKLWKDVKPGADLSDGRDIYPDEDIEGYSCLKDYKDAERDLTTFTGTTVVHAFFKAFGGKDRPLDLSEPFKYYRIEHGTNRIRDKIAYFAEDGWVFRVFDGESYFVKEVS